jgi:hypothetical protein
MKNIMLLLLAALMIQSCEHVETNSAALQANVRSDFFKAYAANAVMDEDQYSITINGVSDNEEIVLHTSWRGIREYELGEGSKSYAMFKDSEGNEYKTSMKGSSGNITITGRSDRRHEVTGTFNFTCAIPGKDTIVVHKGMFYAVPFTIQPAEED